MYDVIVQNRKDCSAQEREVLDGDRRNIGEGWHLLTRPHTNMNINVVDQVGAGNVFFYEEDL